MVSERIKFGVQVRAGPMSSVVQQGKLCEKFGFDSVWYPDHFVGGNPSSMWPELYIAMTMLGINTSKVMIASAATDTLRRHPATIAQTLATVDHVAGGRTALGIGAGEAMNLKPYGMPTDHLYSRLKEAIQVIKLLWTADHTRPAEFQGKFYSLKQAFLQVHPLTNPHPPIYLGAFGPKMLELTGELAEGWLPFSHTPETYRQCLTGAIKKAAEGAGRSLSEIEPAMLPPTVILRDHDEARKQIEGPAKRFLVLLPDILKMIAPKIKHPGASFTLVRWMGRLSKEEMQIISNVAEQIPADLALKTVIWGTPEDAIGQIEEFIKAGCRHLVFGIRGENPDESIQVLGEEVVTYFRDQEKA